MFHDLNLISHKALYTLNAKFCWNNKYSPFKLPIIPQHMHMINLGVEQYSCANFQLWYQHTIWFFCTLEIFCVRYHAKFYHTNFMFKYRNFAWFVTFCNGLKDAQLVFMVPNHFTIFKTFRIIIYNNHDGSLHVTKFIL